MTTAPRRRRCPPTSHAGSRRRPSAKDTGAPARRRKRQMKATGLPTGAALARLHGLFNVAGGLWPLLNMRSFEAVTGPKVDRWLVNTVSGLMIVNGMVQLAAGPSADGVATARRIGMGTALVLGTVDVVYAGRHRISRVYLVDAAMEAGWLLAWARSSHDAPGDPLDAG